MKISIAYTIDVNPKAVKNYLIDRGINDETVREFVKSHCEASGVNLLSDALDEVNNDLDFMSEDWTVR